MVLFSGCAADDPSCGGPVWRTSLAFGAFQLLASQLPSLEAAWWASAVGAAMSVLYSTAAFGMAAARGAAAVDGDGGGFGRCSALGVLLQAVPLLCVYTRAQKGKTNN
jgi:hypothetical protein